jgi:hypothetical protein
MMVWDSFEVKSLPGLGKRKNPQTQTIQREVAEESRNPVFAKFPL